MSLLFFDFLKTNAWILSIVVILISLLNIKDAIYSKDGILISSKNLLPQAHCHPFIAFFNFNFGKQ